MLFHNFTVDNCPHARYVKAYMSSGSNLPDNCQNCVMPGDEARWTCDIDDDCCCDPDDAEHCHKWDTSDKFNQIDNQVVYYCDEDDEYNFAGVTYTKEEIITEIFLPYMEDHLLKAKNLLTEDSINHLKLFLEKLQLERL